MSIVLGIVIAAFIFLWKNDFAKEAHATLFPLVGACIVAFLIGLKTIFVDQPTEVELCEGTSVIVEKQNGEIAGISNFPTNSTDIFRDGIKTIGDAAGLWPEYPNLGQGNTDLEMNRIMDALQYRVVDWIRDINSVQESWFNKEYVYRALGMSAEQADPIIKKEMVSKVIVGQSDFPLNDLFHLKKIKLIGPSGVAISGTSQDFSRIVTLRTKHSTITFRLKMLSGGSMTIDNPEFASIFKRTDVFDLSRISPKEVVKAYFVGYKVSQTFQPWTRFSNEGRLHPQWGIVLGRKFGQSFGFFK